MKLRDKIVVIFIIDVINEAYSCSWPLLEEMLIIESILNAPL